MTLALATVDLVRFDQGRSKQGRWHIRRDETVTLCNFEIPETARIEEGLDAHVVQLRGVAVCARCRGRLA